MVLLLTVTAEVRVLAFSCAFPSRPNSPGKCKEDQMIPVHAMAYYGQQACLTLCSRDYQANYPESETVSSIQGFKQTFALKGDDISVFQGSSLYTDS